MNIPNYYYFLIIDIPTSVTSIGKGAFASSEDLISATIPSSVRSLGVETFKLCKSLQSVTMNSQLSVPDSTFETCSSLVNLNFTTFGNTIVTIGIYKYIFIYYYYYYDYKVIWHFMIA